MAGRPDGGRAGIGAATSCLPARSVCWPRHAVDRFRPALPSGPPPATSKRLVRGRRGMLHASAPGQGRGRRTRPGTMLARRAPARPRAARGNDRGGYVARLRRRLHAVCRSLDVLAADWNVEMHHPFPRPEVRRDAGSPTPWASIRRPDRGALRSLCRCPSGGPGTALTSIRRSSTSTPSSDAGRSTASRDRTRSSSPSGSTGRDPVRIREASRAAPRASPVQRPTTGGGVAPRPAAR